MSLVVAHHNLPWSQSHSEQRAFSVALMLGSVLLIAAAWFIDNYEVPEPDRESLERLPPQLARFVKNEKPKVAPKPVPKKELPKPKAEVKPKPVAKPKPKLEPRPVPKQKPKESIKAQPKKRVQTQKSTAEQIKQAREVASNSGLLAMQSQMAALSSSVAASGFSSSAKQVKAESGPLSIGSPDQSVLSKTSNATAQSEQQIDTRQATLDDQEYSTLQVREEEKALALAEKNAGKTRDMAEVQLVVEGVRSTFNLLYNRALRDDPFLEGALTLKITILSSGLVSSVEVLEDTLGDPKLVAKLVARMKLTNFGPSNAPELVHVLPFNFQPS
ncbi:hypothetical protein A3762_03050 [Oleiphilus sp. HI0125]|uniref:AgmX/PglI C-terminal domain-containing protein n=1 Tax=Oleiphilus sp. HI0125 TaxID=1822266 RepID=UPI0007C2CB23|nr:AgmX/PglI C-terminal domain-containing protein [Oleiphilus sp. HI0125]KZZ60641.1 hypothetical protein A3762_03050 [Oleiphilus sp. HI0125]